MTGGENDPMLSMMLARVRFVSLVTQHLGPEYEAVGEQLADRLSKTILASTPAMRGEDPDERLRALGAAVVRTCDWTLSLLAAVAKGSRGGG